MQSPGTLIHEIERPRKIEQCTLNLTFEEEDEFLLEIVGKKYVLLRRLTAIYHLLSPCVVKSTSPETTLVGRIVSSDVEMNPEDLANILGDEDEDEDAQWVTYYKLLSYNNLC